MKQNADPLQLPLEKIVENQRAAQSLGMLGIETLGNFLDAPREQVLRLPGVDGAFYSSVVGALRKIMTARPWDLSLVPQCFLRCELADLELEPKDIADLQQHGLRTVADALVAPRLVDRIGPSLHAQLHGAIEALARHGTEWANGTPTLLSSAELFARITEGLSPEDRRLFEDRLGVGRPPEPTHRLAKARGVPAKELEHALHRLPHTLLQTAPRVMRLLKRQGQKELRSWDGYVTADLFAAGTLLHTAGRDHDPQLPMRLLALCFPHDFHLCSNALTSTPVHRLRRARPLVRVLTRPVLLPMLVDELARLLKLANAPLDRGLLMHLLEQRRDLEVYIDPAAGDTIDRPQDEMAPRLRDLLEASSEPLSVKQLASLYRQHHGPTKRHRVLARLRNDSRCVEVAADSWTLLARCSKDLDRVRPWAEDASARIRATGRCNVSELVPERAQLNDVYLITALLRRDPSLRDLGRGDFCPRDQQFTPVVAGVERALSRAMGEVPLARFLTNYAGGHKDRVIKVLARNKLFLFPSPDRVDLLTNFPFTPRRLNEMMLIIDDVLDQRDGYAPLDELVQVLRASSLAAEFLTEYLLRDLLSRHTNYDLQFDNVVAAPGRGLAQWIADQAFAVVRDAAFPRSVSELVRESPRLAPFTEHLREMLSADERLILDGERFRCVS